MRAKILKAPMNADPTPIPADDCRVPMIDRFQHSKVFSAAICVRSYRRSSALTAVIRASGNKK
jgi:hypothetical protein